MQNEIYFSERLKDYITAGIATVARSHFSDFNINEKEIFQFYNDKLESKNPGEVIRYIKNSEEEVKAMCGGVVSDFSPPYDEKALVFGRDAYLFWRAAKENDFVDFDDNGKLVYVFNALFKKVIVTGGKAEDYAKLKEYLNKSKASQVFEDVDDEEELPSIDDEYYKY